MIDNFLAWRVAEQADGFQGQVVECSLADLPENDTLIKVIFSSLNYKDALSASGNKGVTSAFPHTPGIDVVGTIVESSNAQFVKNQIVIVTGYDLGMNTWGGFSQYIRVPAQWLIPLPENMPTEFAMALGTAGLTAMLCIQKLEALLGSMAGKSVLVSGATGGVGIWSCALLNAMGGNVTAISGKASATGILSQLGINKVIDRAEFCSKIRPMSKPVYDAAIDVAGGDILVQMLGQIIPSGAVAACGLVASPSFNASIFPFILRGVSLLGVDSVEIPLNEKQSAWVRLAEFSGKINYSLFTKTVNLENLSAEISSILAGKLLGRCLIDPNNN